MFAKDLRFRYKITSFNILAFFINLNFSISTLDYNPDLSAYLTLVAIGCSAVLIIFILLIASICCCCCRRDTNVSGGKRKQKGVGLKNDLNSKLVIKSFPIVTSQSKIHF